MSTYVNAKVSATESALSRINSEGAVVWSKSASYVGLGTMTLNSEESTLFLRTANGSYMMRYIVSVDAATGGVNTWWYW